MTTLFLVAILLMQTKEKVVSKELLERINRSKQPAEVVEEVEQLTEEEHGVAGRGPLRPTSINEELSVRPIGAEVWVIEHAEPWPANSLLVRMTDGTLVLCDTPYDDQATEQLLTWMRKTFGEDSKIVAINSHFHADALGGNGALRAAGVVSYGSKMSALMLKERGAKNQQQLLARLADREDLQKRFKEVTWVPPAEQFDPVEGRELTFGHEKVELFYPGPGHSPDNIVVWFPARQLMFGGCLVRAGSGIPNAADADLEQWPKSIEKLRRFEARVIVPGHGRVGGPKLLDRTLEVIAEYRRKAE